MLSNTELRNNLTLFLDSCKALDLDLLELLLQGNNLAKLDRSLRDPLANADIPGCLLLLDNLKKAYLPLLEAARTPLHSL